MDLRQFQDCRFFLQGSCKNPNCPFAHDEAKRAKMQAALGSRPQAPQDPAAVDCRYFLIGQCRAGAACPFRHDPSKAAAQPAAQQPATVEEKLSRPLEASGPRAVFPRPSFPRPPADDNLMVQLESPKAARVGIGGGVISGPRQLQHLAAVAALETAAALAAGPAASEAA